MSKKKIRIEETDKYDGTDLAKQRLLNLFLYTDGNIKEFCLAAKSYREYFVKTLNSLEEDRKTDCLPYYCDPKWGRFFATLFTTDRHRNGLKL